MRLIYPTFDSKLPILRQLYFPPICVRNFFDVGQILGSFRLKDCDKSGRLPGIVSEQGTWAAFTFWRQMVLHLALKMKRSKCWPDQPAQLIVWFWKVTEWWHTTKGFTECMLTEVLAWTCLWMAQLAVRLMEICATSGFPLNLPPLYFHSWGLLWPLLKCKKSKETTYQKNNDQEDCLIQKQTVCNRQGLSERTKTNCNKQWLSVTGNNCRWQKPTFCTKTDCLW